MKECVLCIQISNACSGLQKSALGDQYNFLSLHSADQAFDLVKRNKENIPSVLIGPGINDPIQLSLRLMSLDRNLAIIIVAAQDKISTLQKSISFTPFLGPTIACVIEGSSNLQDEVKRLLNKVAKQRESKNLTGKLNYKLTDISSSKTSQTTAASNQYFERLLDAAPIGIITLSEDGEILALNKATSDMFEVTEYECLGKKVEFFFPGLALSPDRTEEVTRQSHTELLYLEVTITTISGRDNTGGYLLLVNNISERKKYEKALEKAIVARDEFLSIASHELKTPLTSLKMQLEMTERNMNKYEPEMALSKVSKSTSVALSQVERLTKLVEDLLDVTRVETGKLSYSFEEIDIASLIKQSIERSSEMARTANCSVNYIGPDHLNIVGDSYRLDQVLINLLVNAFKYASGTHVAVKLSESATMVKVEVIDSGMGIEPGKLPFIFDQYARAVSHKNISGLGLGLFISKSIVEAHHGAIEVASKLGKGSTFTVTLPKNK